MNESPITFDEVGVYFPEADVEFIEWEQTTKRLARLSRSSGWLIGDLLNYGQSKYGTKYDQVANDLGLEYQTICNYVWVCRAVPKQVRRADLSFQHHISVAKLTPEEQMNWLAVAALERLSASALKTRIRIISKRQEADKIGTEEDATPDGRYRVLYADIDLDECELDELAMMKLPAAKDSVLFLWCESRQLQDAMMLLDHWNFQYRDHLVWDRSRIESDRWFRNQHSLLLVAVRGDMTEPAPERLAKSVLRTSLTHGRPEGVFAIIEDMFPGDDGRVFRVNLFGDETQKRDGWDLLCSAKEEMTVAG